MRLNEWLDFEAVVLLSAVFAAALVVAADFFALTWLLPLRILSGLYLLFFPAGFLFLSMLFPNKGISLQKVCLSFFASISLTGLSTLLLAKVFGLALSAIFFALLALAIAGISFSLARICKKLVGSQKMKPFSG